MSDLKVQHSLQSVLREQIVEHLLIGELLRLLWSKGRTDVEILRSEFDRGGYDLVAEYGGITRHIQLKCSLVDARAASQKISLDLARRPSGCVLWVRVTDELRIDHFLWFGGRPFEPLPSLEHFRVAKHNKGNSLGEKLDRPNLKLVPKGQFEYVPDFEAVADKLFGDVWRNG